MHFHTNDYCTCANAHLTDNRNTAWVQFYRIPSSYGILFTVRVIAHRTFLLRVFLTSHKYRAAIIRSSFFYSYRCLISNYPRRQCRSAWVGFLSQSVFSVCLSVCPQHNSKKNDPKVFKLDEWNDLGIP